MIDFDPYIDAAKASLKAELPGRIAVVNAAYTDGLVVPTPDPDTGYMLGGHPAIYVPLPTVEVAATDWELGESSIEQLSWELGLSIIVRGVVGHPDPDPNYRITMRFGRAITEVLIEPGAFGPGIAAETIRGSYRVDPQLGEDMQVIGIASMEFALGMVEHRPIL